MKKMLYTMLAIVFTLLVSVSKTNAQYTIASYNGGGGCGGLDSFFVSINGYTTGLTLDVSYGDGSSDVNVVYGPVSGGGYVYGNHFYTVSGVYTIKMVLMNGSSALDSMTILDTVGLCADMYIGMYHDLNSNCVLDAGDYTINIPTSVEIDSAGTPVDTISATHGFFYHALGTTGTIYTFKVVSSLAGLVLTCPSGGTQSDTVNSGGYEKKYFGFECSTSSNFDLAENVVVHAGRHSAVCYIDVTNAYCNPQNATLTLTMSNKYTFSSAYPSPTSVSGNTVTWNLSSVSVDNSYFVDAWFTLAGTTWLVPGDTVNSSFVVTPITGDANTANNSLTSVDTVTASFDPNHKSVTPEGVVSAGTALQYSIEFENTGNDTAFDIHIMDTLSDDLDVNTLKMVNSTARMDIVMLKTPTGQNVVKFDFPNINLLDSSHHGACTGMISFSIKTKTGLPIGTLVPNTAGIYFDANPVVMTNTAYNTIGIPSSVICLSNYADVIIYPNPANSEVIINIGNNNYSNVSVLNGLGQTVLQQPLLARESALNIKSLSPGIYYIQVKGAQGVSVKKLQKL